MASAALFFSLLFFRVLKMTYSEYQTLVAKLNQLCRAYYEDNDSSYPDELYDQDYRKLVEYEKANPNEILEDSPTQRVGYFKSTPFAKVPHTAKMQSLDNVFNAEELIEWKSKYAPNQEVTAEVKCDGLSLAIRYVNGKLVQAVTRGDGNIGEDVTENVKTIDNVPVVLKDTFTGEIRGEVLITIADFNALNEEREELGEPLFANPRNAAAGALRQIDPEVCRQRKLSFFAYSVLPRGRTTFISLGVETQEDAMRYLLSNGMEVAYSVGTIPAEGYSPEVMKVWLDELLEHRRGSIYEIDGIVFKVNKLSLQTRTDSKAPKWAIAYKFPAEERTVPLLNVVWQVGRTGLQTPVAVIPPTSLCGVTIENITLHNPDFIKRNNITIPGRITIIRSGDVIPKVVGAEPDGQPVPIPTTCACCGTDLNWTATEKQIYCPNPKCETKLVLFWENFASRLAMNVIGLSVETIKELVKAEYLTHRLDSLFLLYGFKDNIKEWDGWSDVSTMNLINAIENAKTTDKQRVITALGIEGIGASNAKLIARTFKTLSELPDVTVEQISAIRGLGDVIAESWVRFWGNDSHRESYLEMLKVLTVVDDGNLQEVKGKYAITGKMSEISRKDLERVLNSKGYDLTNTTSADLKGLFVGDKPSSKLAKAEKLNIPILSFEDLDKI